MNPPGAAGGGDGAGGPPGESGAGGGPGAGAVGAAAGAALAPVALRLRALARAGTTETYGAMARALGLRMAVLTAALERLMAEDAAAARPYRAALCEARLGLGLPAPGFFLAAQALGRPVAQTAGAVAAERAAVRAQAQRGP